jgi:single-stranded-DNA-specific exonuclease
MDDPQHPRTTLPPKDNQPGPPSSRVMLRSAPEVQTQTLVDAGVHPLMAKLYAARGVCSPDELQDGLQGLLPPREMHSIEDAASALATAIEEGKRLLIVADFDADGATACAVGLRGLKRFGAQVDFLVPDRFAFGYGLTPALVDHAMKVFADAPPDWIVTVDNGVSSHAGVERAHHHGVQVLITDHHLPGKTLPKALMVNPNQPGCAFKSKNLAGVGVMFYVLMALRAHCRDLRQWPADRIPRLDDLLPIVALGTVADVVRLDANNRRLVAQGLSRIRKGNTFPGLLALFEVAGQEARTATATTLGFSIGPRLNAAGRLSDMSIGIRCLIEDDPNEAYRLAETLDRLNRERRELESSAQEEAVTQAMDQLERRHLIAERQRVLILYEQHWHQGIIGLIASRLKERFFLPTFAFASDGDSGRIKGSARSIPGLHVRDLLERIDTENPGLLIAFGGHAMAAGLTLEAKDFDHFRDCLTDTISTFAEPTLFDRTLETDGPLEAELTRLDVAELIAQQVWGQGFPAPVFINQFRVLAQRRLKEKHLKLTLVHEDAPHGKSRPIEAIWFNAPLDLADRARLAYRLAVNRYQGTSTVQLEIVELA